jgi:hypothetical protein
MPAPDASPAVPHPWRARLTIAAVVTALVVLMVPAGSVAARLSLGGAGTLASSPEFNLRWREEVTEADRPRLEDALGLVNLGQVERDPRRRTWTYQLRSPTFPGLQAVLAHPGVEDTSLDAAQLEMLRQ